MDYVKLSKKLSYALRHNPDEFGLTLDSEGYVNINDLCSAVGCTRTDIYHIVNVLQMQDGAKKRFELKGFNKIRACYGHSTDQVKINYVESIPPKVLYHGTTYDNYKAISISGLKPMSRQYVHLSEDIETAMIVGDRYAKGSVIALFVIDTESAIEDGIKFYKGNDTTWLTDKVPAKYFSQVEMKIRR